MKQLKQDPLYPDLVTDDIILSRITKQYTFSGRAYAYPIPTR